MSHAIVPPPELKCIITQNLPQKPVLAGDGHVYDQWAILDHFERNMTEEGPLSPVTKKPMSQKLTPVRVNFNPPEHDAATDKESESSFGSYSPASPTSEDSKLYSADAGASVIVPLIWAVKQGHPGLITAMLKVPGINPNLPSRSNGKSPLTLALDAGRMDIVLLMMSFPSVNPPALADCIASGNAKLVKV